MKKGWIKGIGMLLALTMVLSFVPMLSTEVKAVTVNQQNIADRADFFFNTTWVCQEDVNAWRDEFVFRKGETYHLPYGQPVNSGKFIGYGVELEDFLIAAADGDSVFYSTQSEFNGWTSVYYATDCAAFVAMCWGTVRQDCSTLPYYSTYKGKPTETNIYNTLQLGDALDSTSVGHVVLVSDLIYDADGNLIQIEITEQTPPQLKRTYFTPSELAAKYGEEFGIYRYEGSVPAAPEWGYTTECANYAAYCTINVTEDTPIMSLPCATTVEAESIQIGTAYFGQNYTATRLYSNTANELWYRIETGSDGPGYIPAGNTMYKEILLNDIHLTDAVYPSAHVKGKTFSLVGNIYSRYNQLITVSAYIYQGFGAVGSPKTGATDYVTGNAYTLKSSQIDYKTSFGDLFVGNHTMTISANYRSYYVENGTILENSGTVELCQEYFMVVNTSTNQTNCNHRYTQTVLSVGTCNQTGLSVFACASCGNVYKQIENAPGHAFGEWTVIEATCTKDGTKARLCTLCGETQVNILEAKGHQYSEEVIVGSCQETPRTIYTCDACSHTYTVYPEEIMSPWLESVPDDIDAGLIETKTQYRTSELEVTLSSEKELEGFMNLGETWETVQTENFEYVNQWPTGFDTTNPLYEQYHKEPLVSSEDETTRIAVDNDGVKSYLYYHWCYNNSYFSQANKGGQYTIFHAYYSTTKPESYRVDTSDMSYCTNHESCSNTDWFFVVQVNTQSVTTHQKMYLQGKWPDYSEWSDSTAFPSDTLRVETRTLYRYPDLNVAGHTYEISETAPTCSDPGATVYTCIICGDVYKNEIPALGHSYTTTVVGATCTQDGTVTDTCINCGDVQLQIIPAPGHQFETLVTEPTCTQDGYTVYSCSCGESYTADIITASGHHYDRVIIEVSCTQDGSITDTCSVCGDVQLQITSAPGHQYYTVVTAPTCTETGYTTYTCSCGDTYTTNETEALGHAYQMEVVDATCTKDGSINAVCSACGDTKIGVIPASGHQYANGRCTVCGENEAVQIIKPTVTLKSPTLEFKDTICIVAFYTAENTADVVEMGMITYDKKVDVWNVETADHVIPGANYDASTGRYYSSSQGIHAKYLADTVYLACYAKLTDGSYVYTKLAPYSAITYAKSQLKNSTNTALKQLVVAMLNYGTEAQVYFGYNTQNLANANLTQDQAALPEIYDGDMASTVPTVSALKQGYFANNSGFTSRKPAISFEDAFCINYFFTPKYAPTDGITMYYWNEDDFEAVDVLTVENASGTITLEGSGITQYRGDITGISAKNLSQAIYVAAVYSDGNTTWSSGVLGYSIGAYCSSQVSKGTDVADLAMSTAVYGYHAKQYFG